VHNVRNWIPVIVMGIPFLMMLSATAATGWRWRFGRRASLVLGVVTLGCVVILLLGGS